MATGAISVDVIMKTERRQQPLLPMTGNKFALSVDVEDYFQVWAFSNVIKRQSWDGYEFRVGAATRACLDLLDRHNAKATFFTLGWVAERDRELVREIVARGHELGSHGYDHVKVNQQTREEFHEDASRTKAMLEDISGAEVTGYRAAGFSIDATTPWAHETLAEIGYRYSSSSHPISHDHYGDERGAQNPFTPIAGDAFLEAPVATTSFLGRRISCAGGGWFRAAPAPISKALLRRAAASLSGPVIFYFHPWELDPAQPRISRAPAKSRFRHYLNLDRMKEKLASVLSTFTWGRVDHALGLSIRSEAP
jgi:peptidoglycan-N-acetylglucosamine deacetylase